MEIGEDPSSGIQEKPSIHERLEANKAKIEDGRQKKSGHAPVAFPASGETDLHGLLEHNKAEAVKQNVELMENRQNERPDYSPQESSR